MIDVKQAVQKSKATAAEMLEQGSSNLEEIAETGELVAVKLREIASR